MRAELTRRERVQGKIKILFSQDRTILLPLNSNNSPDDLVVHGIETSCVMTLQRLFHVNWIFLELFTVSNFALILMDFLLLILII